MKNEQLAEQALLASEILRTGCEWEYRSPLSYPEWRKEHRPENCPLYRIGDGYKIRLALATPGDARPLHNPDGLTAEQVGAGWRLLLEEELDGRYRKGFNLHWWSRCFGENNGVGWHKDEEACFAKWPKEAYRVPLSVPWPEAPKVDSFAELKAAQKAGKTLQVVSMDGIYRDWLGGEEFEHRQAANFRIKPEPVMIPLGPDDCPPGSVFRGVGWSSGMYRNVWEVCETGVAWTKDILTDWNLLQDNYEINRSIPKTGKWDKDAWVSCSKPQT